MPASHDKFALAAYSAALLAGVAFAEGAHERHQHHGKDGAARTIELKLAEAKLKLLSRLPIRVVGVVLNTVHIGHDFGYYAGTYSDPSEETRLPVLETKIGEFARRSGLST